MALLVPDLEQRSVVESEGYSGSIKILGPGCRFPDDPLAIRTIMRVRRCQTYILALVKGEQEHLHMLRCHPLVRMAS